MTRPVAVLCSDLHFSHRPPVARSAEPDWYAAMERQWFQIRAEAEEEDVPVVIAGDIFDNCRSTPELVNFVIRLFRGLTVYAIPGQHDLPNHVYDDMHRSSYGTLVEAGAIENISSVIGIGRRESGAGRMKDSGLVLYPAAWGFNIMPVTKQSNGMIALLVAHRYVWTTEKTCYPGAPQEANLAGLKKQLEGYDAAVFGDNHKGFRAISGRCYVLNCGGFMARKSDERNYKPRFGLLHDDGHIDSISLDVSKDNWIDPEDMNALVDEPLNLTGLIDEFEHLGSDALDFAEVLIRTMEREATDESVKQKVIEALQRGREDEEK